MKNGRLKIYIRGIITGILVSAVLFALINYLGIHILPSSSLADDVWKRAQVVEKYIDTYYWKEDVSDLEISENAAKGMVSALGDKYSAYYTQEEYEKAMNGVEGSYNGIGMTIKEDEETKQKIVVEVKKGRPAQKAGLKAGDILKKINGTDVTDLSLSDTVKQIGTNEGDRSQLVVSRKTDKEESTFEVEVVCEEIINQSVSAKMLKGNIGYIRITDFDNRTTGQFEDELKKMDKKGQKGLILDVRDNGGGSLTAVISILDDLLPKGVLITERCRNREDKVYESTDEKYFDKPIVVLINQGSASASEVLAGTLQDRGAASLVGVKSFGKGIVQTIFSLEKSCGGGIKLTTGEYLLPSGRSIHEKGLTPDVESVYTGVENRYGEEDDNQLKKAWEVMEAKLE